MDSHTFLLTNFIAIIWQQIVFVPLLLIKSVWSNYRPHVAHHSIFSGPRKHSGKIFKCEICRQVYEVTFASLNCLCWIKCICTKNDSWFLCVTFCFISLFYDQIRRYGLPLTLRWGTCLDNLCVISVQRRSLSWRVHLAQWTQYCQINLSTCKTRPSLSGPQNKVMAHHCNR